MKKEQTELLKERSATRMTKGHSLQTTPTYDALVSAIEGLALDARAGLKAAMNAIMLQTYWRTGEYIVEYEQNGSDRAVYGAGLMRRLAHDLTLRLGRGFAHSNLNYMRKFNLVSQSPDVWIFREKSDVWLFDMEPLSGNPSRRRSA